MHLLALRISSFLSLKPDAVLKHWASAKILRSKPTTTGSVKDAELDGEEEVCKLIVEKFKQLGGADVSYADIAKRAWEVGRPGLATKVCFISLLCLTSPESSIQLLDHESRASDQVPLLLTMKQDRLALEKAVDSGDTDLGRVLSPLSLFFIETTPMQSTTYFYICINGLLSETFSA